MIAELFIAISMIQFSQPDPQKPDDESVDKCAEDGAARKRMALWLVVAFCAMAYLLIAFGVSRFLL